MELDRIGTGHTEGDPALEGMLTADEVADVVLSRWRGPGDADPDASFRPMTERSWG